MAVTQKEIQLYRDRGNYTDRPRDLGPGMKVERERVQCFRPFLRAMGKQQKGRVSKDNVQALGNGPKVKT